MIIPVLHVVLGKCHCAVARWPLDLTETEISYGQWLLPFMAHFMSVFLLSQGVHIVSIVTEAQPPSGGGKPRTSTQELPPQSPTALT